MKLAIASVALLLAVATQAQTLQGDALVAALHKGGNVIVMRHASSPRDAPDKTKANPDNLKLERQLDDEGRTTAIAMGDAIRRLKISITGVATSPTYRALETVKYARLTTQPGDDTGMIVRAGLAPELGDNGQSMQGGTEAQAAWLRKAVTRFPPLTSNIILVTHFPNIRAAFPELADVADGESLIFGPDGKGGATLIGRIKIEDWPKLK